MSFNSKETRLLYVKYDKLRTFQVNKTSLGKFLLMFVVVVYKLYYYFFLLSHTFVSVGLHFKITHFNSFLLFIMAISA